MKNEFGRLILSIFKTYYINQQNYKILLEMAGINLCGKSFSTWWQKHDQKVQNNMLDFIKILKMCAL